MKDNEKKSVNCFGCFEFFLSRRLLFAQRARKFYFSGEMANLLTLTTFIFMAACATSFFVSSQSLDNLQYPKKSFIETLLTRPIFADGQNRDLADLKYPSESLISSIVSRVLTTFTRIRVSLSEFKRLKKEKEFEINHRFFEISNIIEILALVIRF